MKLLYYNHHLFSNKRYILFPTGKFFSVEYSSTLLLTLIFNLITKLSANNSISCCFHRNVNIRFIDSSKFTNIYQYSIYYRYRLQKLIRKKRSWEMFAADDLLISLFSGKLTACSILCEICFIFTLIRLSM